MGQSNGELFDLDKMGKAVQAFIRARAIQKGSSIVYAENGQIVKENPRTGEKIIVKSTSNK